MSNAALLVDELVRRFAESRPLRAGSFIVTVYGDAVVPRGGELALSSLIRIVEPFGISETLVRTAVSRLVQEGWLEGTRIGRRSFYRLTPSGAERFADATRRIYHGPPKPWTGELTLVLVPDAGATREAIRRELRWIGFGSLGFGVMFHPAPDREALRHALAPSGLSENALITTGRAESNGTLLRRLAADAWPLDDLAYRYCGFSALFAPVGECLARGDRLALESALALRLLLVHEFRKAVLRDPLLPPELLPTDWPGTAAHDLAAAIYRRVAAPAEHALDALGETSSGPLPPADPAVFRRFG